MATAPLEPILLAGYFGHGNAGDEMILDLLRRRFGLAPFLSGPAPRGPNAVPRFHLPSVFRALRHSRALLLGGGELFQTRTSVRSLFYYLSLPLLARWFRRPVFGFSLGLDPHLPLTFRSLTASVLRGARRLWVRDERSRVFLAGRGVGADLMPDIVWAWPAPAAPPPTTLRRILWIPRFSSGGPESASWIEGVRSLSAGANWEHGFLPLHPTEDGPSLARARARFPFPHRLETWADPDDLFDRITRYDLVVSLRYHGLLAAVLAHRPALAVEVYGKVGDLARELGVPVIPPSVAGFEAWREMLIRAFLAGPVDPGDRPARAKEALEALGRSLADTALKKL
ncbi:MAG: polysaccharide pyruvyl transferase family protein [Elusimicrobia bacterium]|nr:polysaccharide pyruvyl transferase family protein [Elusimicrobiota bacterium]